MLVLLRRTSFWPPSMVYISVQMLQIFIWASEGSFHVLHLSVHNSTTKPPRLDNMVYALNLKYGVYFKSQRSCIISNLIIFKYLSRFEPVTFRSWSRWHTNMPLGIPFRSIKSLGSNIVKGVLCMWFSLVLVINLWLFSLGHLYVTFNGFTQQIPT